MRGVAARLGEPDAGEALTWLRSPLSRRVLDVENQADSPGRQEEAQEFLATLPETPPDPARLALIARLGRAMRLTYLHQAYFEAFERDLVRNMWKFLTPAGRDGSMRPCRAPSDGWLAWSGSPSTPWWNLLTTYRPLSEAELEELVTFSESPAGAWCLRGVPGGAPGGRRGGGRARPRRPPRRRRSAVDQGAPPTGNRAHPPALLTP